MAEIVGTPEIFPENQLFLTEKYCSNGGGGVYCAAVWTDDLLAPLQQRESGQFEATQN